MFFEKYQTDWLSSHIIFYNTRDNRISDNINELIDPHNIIIHPEGLCNYLQYGYCVFGQTPISDIKFLLPNQKIYKNSSGDIVIEDVDDPFDNLLGLHCSSEKVIEELERVIIDFQTDNKNKKFIIPTSGGFDSRIINALWGKKENAFAFTYGISKIPSESLDVVYAKKLCEITGVNWKEIILGDYVKLIDRWDELMGIATHSHGMYQMEFYSKIKELGIDYTVISGIFGDIWAGNWDFPDIDSPEDLIILGKSYVEHIDPVHCKLKTDYAIRDNYYRLKKEKLKDRNWRVLEAGRTKIMLISYLMRVPEYYGFPTWSPFLDAGVVSSMLNLDWPEKKGRKWQVDYFRKKGLLIGEMGLKCDPTNFLNQYALLKNRPKALNVSLMEQLFDKCFVENVNKCVYSCDVNNLDWWYKYQVMYPIQKVLEIKEYGRKL